MDHVRSPLFAFRVLLVFLDDTGLIQRTSLDQSSGHRALDDTALELARIIQFNPAQNGGKAVPVLVRVPINLVPPAPRRGVKEIRDLN